MCEYGFNDGIDFSSILSESTGGRPATDHQLTIDMAKEIAMLQRNEKGKQARQYFIEVEKEFNSPEKVMARALKIADETINTLRLENKQQEQIIYELQPKATYYDLILQNSSLLSISVIAKDYGMSATAMNKLLHDLGVQYNLSGTWLLYQKNADKGYTSSKTQNFNKADGTQGSKLHTYWTQKGRLFIYDLLKKNHILPLIEREVA
jgi:anti-repressor protein